jgi:transportin-1
MDFTLSRLLSFTLWPFILLHFSFLISVASRCFFLQGMRYSDEEIADLVAGQEDSMEPDRAEDLRPIFHKKGKGKGGGGHRKLHRQNSEGNSGGSSGGGNGEDGQEEEEDNGDDGSDESGDDDDEVESFSLRKRCAATLDKVSERFGPAVVLPLVLPELQQRLGSDSVWVREAAILALGALQTGADDGLDKHLPQLFPYLLEHMAHPGSPQLREISCWTVGRYLAWAVQQAWASPGGGAAPAEPDCAQLLPLTQALLARVSDSNKKVQQFACSTLAIYAEACSEYECDAAFRGPMAQPIFACLLAALSNYQVLGCYFNG